jgi:putative PIN family toxin of toxin-antitoxin system
MKSVVLDTNIVISSVISSNGNPSAIMSLVSDGEIQAYYSNEILDEYKKVLAYDRLKINSEKQVEIIEKIIEQGILIEPEKSDIPLPDESDRVFYDTAKDANAILITGNIKHFPNEDFILTPVQFLALYSD